MAISLALVITCGIAIDYVCRKYNIPGLVGMLAIGVLLGPFVLDWINPGLLGISKDLRMIALIVILLRAGLELKRTTLRRVGRSALILSFLPAVFEGLAITLIAPLLFDISILEAGILGTIIAAVSPAVVVPMMIDFIEKKRGTDKNIPTLVISASSLDDVFVIVIFTILIGLEGEQADSIVRNIIKIPETILLGILIGLVAGYLVYRLLLRFQLRATKMTLGILSAAILLVWLEEVTGNVVHFSALLAVMTIGVVMIEKSEQMSHKIAQKLTKIWVFAEILLFVLVATQLDIELVMEAGLSGALLICIGVIVRAGGTMLAMTGSGFTWRERLFIAVAYTPKATVQAAIGAIPFEMGFGAGGLILAISVLSIVLTAPLGAIGIQLAGQRWLNQEETNLDPDKLQTSQ